jgi:protein-S-isoprenylcysteine O-methyltransferase Ste14
METSTILSISTLILFCLLILFLAAVVVQQLLKGQALLGKPPVPLVLFVLAKGCVVVNIVFLFLRGLGFRNFSLFAPPLWISVIALLLIGMGILLLFFSSIALKKDLIFGLPGEQLNMLQTKGVYSFSRHPFYLGFIFILFSSCLLYPNIVNILAFITAWTIHHFIMKKEEEFLEKQYGDEYREYKTRVNRYITFK